MEVLERSLKVERCWYVRMNGEEEKNLVYRSVGVGHGRANILELWPLFLLQTLARPCQL
jgi:hypothetical protein